MKRKRNGTYILTSAGKIVYKVLTIIEKVVNNERKLKAIDSLELSDNLLTEERIKIIDTLIDDNKLRQFIRDFWVK